MIFGVTACVKSGELLVEELYQVPFVARRKKLLPASESADSTNYYDPVRQIWVSAESGEALVVRSIRMRSSPVASSDFGETSLTRTSEGADQNEGRVEQESSVDRLSSASRGRLLASQFGETLVTETGEGVDQSERTSSS